MTYLRKIHQCWLRSPRKQRALWPHEKRSWTSLYRIDFGCSIGPSREEKAGRVGGLSCDTRRYQTPVMGNVRKYWTHFVLCLFVRIYIDLAFAKFGVKLQQSSLSLLLSTTIVAEWKIINDSDTVGWISKTYLSFASFSKRALFFVNVSGC